MSMNQLPLISVIIPVYGGERFIHECVDSVLSQTYYNIECILIDGDSPDKCPQICEEYEKRDQRVKVIHKKNKGLSDDRNAGFRVSKGEYITFVDVDDVLSVDMIQCLFQLCIKYNVLLAQCSYTTKSAVFETVVDGKEHGTLIEKERCMNEFFGKYAMEFCVAWGKLIHKTVIEACDFPVGKAHEDVYTIYRYFEAAGKIIYTTKRLYYYRQHQSSLIAQGKNRPDIEELKANIERKHFFKSKGYKQAYISQSWDLIFKIIRQYCVFYTYWSTGKKKYMRQEYKKCFISVVMTGRKRIDVKFWLFAVMPDIYFYWQRARHLSENM